MFWIFYWYSISHTVLSSEDAAVIEKLVHVGSANTFDVGVGWILEW